MANLKWGSTGEDVKKMQQALINAGYDVGKAGADGIVGKGTDAAIRKYQKDNGLAVDGIAGKNTLGKLYSSGNNGNTGGAQKTNTGSNTGTGGNTFTTSAGNTYEVFTPEEVTYDPFQGTETLNQAWATLGQLQGNAPGAFTDPNNYKDKYTGYLSQYENRDPFSYDFNSDALYQQYKDQYIQQGQMAMMDTMGQAAAMTGGYGNSYAQTVGQQAYNQQLNQLNAIMPELYDRAYGIYQQEGQELLDMYNAYLGLYQNDYNMYLGDVDNYYQQLNAATQYAQNLYNKEYGEWADKTGMDIDIANNKNSIGLDTWATQLGIMNSDDQMLSNQKFQSDEAQKDRDFTSTQNQLNRDAEVEAATIKAAAESNMNTEDTMVWLKRYQSATSLEELDKLTSALAGVIGNEAAAEWYDLYAAAFEDEEDEDNWVDPNSKAGRVKGAMGGAGGTTYTMTK